MSKRAMIIGAGVAAAAALALGGAAIANATDDDDGAPLKGATLDRASAAALKAAGGGRVTETEHDTEDGATYEVEVTRADGSQVDVRLDGSFRVVVVEGDREEAGDDENE